MSWHHIAPDLPLAHGPYRTAVVARASFASVALAVALPARPRRAGKRRYRSTAFRA